jgi:hypothetical protein
LRQRERLSTEYLDLSLELRAMTAGGCLKSDLGMSRESRDFIRCDFFQMRLSISDQQGQFCTRKCLYQKLD